MPSTNPVIVVHGVQGSWLKDQYPVNFQDSLLWTGVWHRDFDRLHLHALDATVDAEPKRLVMPHQAIPLIYERLVEEIRDELDETHPYVYVFTYDWRKDNRLAAAELGRFVERVLHIAGVHERGKKPPARRPKRVTLVGHSMGGLVIKWYATKTLSAAKAKQRIERIVTIATPYRGSLKAVEALLPGARNLFGVENKKSMRHAARTMPGVYQLLPRWPEAVVRKDDGNPHSIFNPGNWQKSLVDAMSTRFGGPQFFQRMLADADAFTTASEAPWPKALCSRVYTVVGVDTETWWQVPVDTAKDNFFCFNEVSTDVSDPALPGGDGTVHTKSAIRPEVAKRNRYDDLKELKDILAGHHANMPNHSGAQDWVLGKLKLNEHSGAAFESIA